MPVSALLVAGLAAAGGAALRYGAERAQAKAMFPEEWEKKLAELQAGGGALTAEQRASMEAEGVAARAGVITDAQQRQLQQAQSMSGSGAIGARDLFQGEVATQQVQAKMLEQQTQDIRAAEIAAKEKAEALQMELEMAKSSSQGAATAAFWNAGSTAVGAGGQIAMTKFALEQEAAANEQWLEEQARNRDAMIMAASYGYRSPYSSQADPYQYQSSPYDPHTRVP